MLIAVIPVYHYQQAKDDIQQAHHHADGIELRLDYLTEFNINTIHRLRNECTLPIIFTLRKISQGGVYSKSEEQRLQDIALLCQCNPDYIDIEYDVPKRFLKPLSLRYTHIQWICSYHNFNETPPDLEALVKSLENTLFHSYKIATKANNILDSLRMLECVKKLHAQYRLTGLCMGERGQITRILNPIIGNAMNYAVLHMKHMTAPGQLTFHELLTTYHYRQLNTNTKIYALLGDPISLSVGHILHNQAIEFLDENAVYVKLQVIPNELSHLLEKCRHLPFSGFSITMPLKESVLPLLDNVEEYSQPIKAINSIIKIENAFIGFNTDGKGAIQALSEKTAISEKTIVILGAGGSARAIAYEARRQKAHVIILNRTASKAKQLADELGCQWGTLNELKKIRYSLLINTLPNTIYSNPKINPWIHHDDLPADAIAMDIVYQPLSTIFLEIAKKANYICIFGYKMYINQALLQIQSWFQPTEQQRHHIKNKMEQFFQNLLKI